MINVSLSSFKSFFQKEGFESKILEKNNQIHQSQLFVLLGKDEKLRDLVSQIQITEQEMPSTGTKRSTYYHIQFLLLMPFERKINDLTELLRFVQILNRAANIPGFEISENDGLVFYRHAFFHAGNRIDEGLLRSVMGTILMQVNTFGGLIEEVLIGAKSCNDVLQVLKEYEKSLHEAV